MKQNNFLRFYVLFFVVACLFIISFTQLYKVYFAPPLYHTVNVDDIFTGLQNNTSAEFKIIEKANIQLPLELQDSLEQNEIIAYSVGVNSYYVKALNQKEVIQWGPVPAEEWEEPKDSLSIFIFYCTLALVFLMLLRPLFRDVAYLQKCAIEFGIKPSSQPLNTSPKSSVFPLAQALHKMSHQLLDQIRLHKDLSNIIAHEVRTPLARMKFILQSISADIPEKQLARFKRDINALETLAHEYLEFGRSQITDENYMEEIDLYRFSEEMEDKYIETGKQVSFIPPSSNYTFKANSLQLDLALSNLINNALRYAKSKIEVSILVTESNIDFIVVDDGPGFSQTQKSSANGENHHGFGLGLYIVKQVALRHNGKFTIDASTEGGAKMTIQLPIN